MTQETLLRTIYAGETTPDVFSKSLFLAGPTSRDPAVPSWRLEALRILGRLGYDGIVFVPEDRDGGRHLDLDQQAAWEAAAMNRSDQVVFWIPRKLGTMPGLTTNHEFGAMSVRDPLRVVLGTPPLDQADKIGYQHIRAKKLHIPTFFDLEEALACALKRIGDGIERAGGEQAVPLHIFRTPSFKQWVSNLRAAGNRLDDAYVEWTLRPKPRPDIALFWIAWVKIWIGAEQRHKTEKVIARPDLSAVLAYCAGEGPRKTRVVLVREFRAPVNNLQGAVLELPSGSNYSADQTAQELAAQELREETGLDLPAKRFVSCGMRQIVAPFSTHSVNLHAVELSPEEMNAQAAKEAMGYAFGDGHGDEQTQVVVRTVGDLLDPLPGDPPVDWNTLGLVLAGLDFAGRGS